MKKQLIRVAPFQSAKVMAALYLVMSIPFGLLIFFMPRPLGMPFNGWMVLVVPVLYAVLGFVFALIGAWIYNLVAAGVGGFEFTTVEVAPEE